MFKNIFTLLFCLFAFGLQTLQAQQLGLHFMDNVWQTNHTNPAKAPDQKVIFSFPNVYSGFSHSALSFNDLTSVNDQGKTVLNSKQLLANLEDQNYLGIQASAESFNLAITVLNMQFSLHHAVKFNGILNYPKSLVQFALEGNAPFIGQEINIAPSLNLLAYNEFGLGFNMRLAKLHVGGRIKMLNGMGTISTENADISIRTDEEIYQLGLTSDYQINAAGVVALDIANNDFNPDVDFDQYSVGDFLKINRGWGLDIGAQYQLNDKLTLAASIVDLGYINWKENTVNLKSQGNFEFGGLKIDDFINDDQIEVNISEDTILNTFNFVESREAFTTFLPSKVYLSGTYQVLPIFRAGGLIYLENQKGKTFKALSLNGTLVLKRIFHLGATYSIYNRSYSNVGLNFQLKLGPIQLFGVSDNVLAAMRPANSRGTNFRFGLNLVFGKRGVKIPVVGEVEDTKKYF